MPFDQRKAQRVKEILGDPDMYPSELLSWILKKLSDNPYFAVSQIQLPTVEPVHQVGDSGEPAFQNGWVNYSSLFNPAAFWKDPWGVVHLRGLVKDGTINTTIFTLPAGYRPEYQQLFVALEESTLGRVDVLADGQVQMKQGVGTNWLSLDGMTFRQFS